MLSALEHIFHAMVTLAALLAVGAGVGLSASIMDRLIGGLTGLSVAAALGAFIMVGTYWSGAVDQMSYAKVERLKAQNAELSKQAEALSAVRDKEQELITSQQSRLDAQETVITELNSVVDANDKKDAKAGAPTCRVAVHRDELKTIRKMR